VSAWWWGLQVARGKDAARYAMAAGVMASIEGHAYSNLTAEVGGMLMGSVEKGRTTIVGSIPALAASAEQVTLTFTHEVWEDILSLAAKEFPDHSIVGWYHTHPTFGIFLSDYDMFIQENFFGAPGNFALVIDPVQGLYGWFGQNAAGGVEVCEEGVTSRGPRRASEPTVHASFSSRKTGIKIALAAGIGVLVGSALSAGIVMSQAPPDLSATLQSTKTQVTDLQGRLEALRGETQSELEALRAEKQELLAQPVLQYVVQEGDTVESIAIMFYLERSEGQKLIMASNGITRFENLRAGEGVLVPAPSIVGITVLQFNDVVPQQPTDTDTDNHADNHADNDTDTDNATPAETDDSVALEPGVVE
jgi:proteasome lid subunit RPN8/RPN11/LysM repeat protein